MHALLQQRHGRRADLDAEVAGDRRRISSLERLVQHRDRLGLLDLGYRAGRRAVLATWRCRDRACAGMGSASPSTVSRSAKRKPATGADAISLTGKAVRPSPLGTFF